MSKAYNTIYKAIKEHAGLSEFDHYGIDQEVKAILRALKRNNLKITETKS